MTTGHAVFEVRPHVPWNKGSAAAWIRERCGADAEPILVLGDDRTDEDTFDALPQAITVKIGRALARPPATGYPRRPRWLFS